MKWEIERKGYKMIAITNNQHFCDKDPRTSVATVDIQDVIPDIFGMKVFTQ